MILRHRSRRSRMRVQQSHTLHCEFLEDRRVLATFTVGDLGDTPDANPGDGIAADAAGNTTLRAAIEEANALAGADNIDFSVAGTVNLTLGTLTVTDDLDVNGGNNVTVDAGGVSTVMTFTGGTAQLTDITLTNGSAIRGGGINASSDLTLSGATVSNSYAVEMGGGIFSTAGLSLVNNSLVTGNNAGSGMATAFGGGVVNYQGTLDIDDSTVSMNTSTQYAGGVLGMQSTVRVVNNSYITGNLVNNTAGAYASGAGLSMASSLYFGTTGSAPFDLTVDSSTLNDNVLYGTNFPYGGALYSFGYGNVSVSATTIRGNMITGSGGARGAAGFNWPAGANGAGALTIDIVDTVMDSNYSAEDSAGFGFRATSIDNPVFMTITGSTISNNTALGSGAAGFNWSAGDDPNSALLTITNSMITGNSATGTGGAFETNNATVTIQDSTLDGNTADGGGGAVYSTGSDLDDYGWSVPRTSFIRSTISNNYTIASAGAAYGYDADIFLDNSTVSGNSAQTSGGAFSKRTYYGYTGTAYDSAVDLNNTTVTNNFAYFTGGGFYTDDYSSVRFHNSIISGNMDTSGSPDAYILYSIDSTYSLIGDGTGTGLAAANPDVNGNVIGDAASPVNAMLGPLMNNGGGTLTHLPMAGSPAIDAGDPATMGGTDQTGGPRVNNGRVDMGSVETGMSSVTGDFNNDGNWDCADINALTAETAAGTNNAMFDMTGDGLVNATDIAEWLIVGGAMNPAATGGNPFLAGDADLNGSVDGADFIAWNGSKFTTNTDWCGGNFDGNGATDGADFIVWNSNKFMSSGTDNGHVPDAQSARSRPNGLRGKKELRAREVGSGLRANAVAPLSVTQSAAAKAEEVATNVVPAATLATPQLVLKAHAIKSISDSISHDDAEETEALDQFFASL